MVSDRVENINDEFRCVACHAGPCRRHERH